MEDLSPLPIRQDMPPSLQQERKYGKNGQECYFCKSLLKEMGNQVNRCSFLTYVAKDDQISVNLGLLLFGGRTEWFLLLFTEKKNVPTGTVGSLQATMRKASLKTKLTVE